MKKLVAIFFVTLIVLIFILSWKSQSDVKKYLPNFHAYSVKGETLISHSLNKNVFVIFITSKEPYHIELLRAVYEKYYKSGLEIIAIISDSSIYSSLDVFPEIWIIIDRKDRYLNLFDARSCCGRHYLYDSNHRLIVAGNNTVRYEDGVKVYLQQVIDHRTFHYSMLLPDNNIADNGMFSDIWENLGAQNKENYFIFMISDVCMACPISKKIFDLSLAANRSRDSLEGIIIVSSDFSDTDIKNFETQWNTGLQILRATGDLADHWDLLINEYRREDVNGILLLIDADGDVRAANEDAFKELGI